MKALKILALAVGIVFLGCEPATTGQQEVSYRYESTLSFKTCLFEADIKAGREPEKEGEPDILLLARIYESGLSEEPVGQLDNLRSYFRLPDLALKKQSGEIDMTWEVYEEGKNKKDEIKKNQKIWQVAELNGNEYMIFIIPQQINVKDNDYQFLLEIHRIQEKDAAGLVSTELLMKKELLWNFHGPLAIGFFFPDKVYFITFTIWAGWSSSGGRIGTRISGII
ncbi:MAG: hypothetical protein OEW18_08610 [Candidatus Aminicenantes bacterium]|nr:hypothetical protein [Candidatus Aminicenantes bacterium]